MIFWLLSIHLIFFASSKASHVNVGLDCDLDNSTIYLGLNDFGKILRNTLSTLEIIGNVYTFTSNARPITRLIGMDLAKGGHVPLSGDLGP